MQKSGMGPAFSDHKTELTDQRMIVRSEQVAICVLNRYLQCSTLLER